MIVGQNSSAMTTRDKSSRIIRLWDDRVYLLVEEGDICRKAPILN